METTAQQAGQCHPQSLPQVQGMIEAAAHRELTGGIRQVGIGGISQMGQVLLIGKNPDVTALGRKVRGIAGTNQQPPAVLFPVGQGLAQW